MCRMLELKKPCVIIVQAQLTEDILIPSFSRTPPIIRDMAYLCSKLITCTNILVQVHSLTWVTESEQVFLWSLCPAPWPILHIAARDLLQAESGQVILGPPNSLKYSHHTEHLNPNSYHVALGPLASRPHLLPSPQASPDPWSPCCPHFPTFAGCSLCLRTRCCIFVWETSSLSDINAPLPPPQTTPAEIHPSHQVAGKPSSCLFFIALLPLLII